MTMRRMTGMSLAFAVISASAIAQTPEKNASQNPRGSSDVARSHSYRAAVRPAGQSQTGRAAWYNLVGNQTASGERLDTVTATAAHRSLPLASYAKVTNLDSGRSVIVKINDRGPLSRRFIIDLSPRAAEEIEMKHAGVAPVVVEPVVLVPAPPGEPASTVAVLQTSDPPAMQSPGL